MKKNKNLNQTSIFNRILWNANGNWEVIGYWQDDLILDNLVKLKFCQRCPLASRAHPHVEEHFNSNSLDKICTLSAILKNIITLDKVMSDKLGCCQKKNDRIRAEKLLKNLKINRIQYSN